MTTKSQVTLLKKAFIDIETYKEEAELFVNNEKDKAVVLRRVIFNILHDAGMTANYLVFSYAGHVQIASVVDCENLFFGVADFTSTTCEAIKNSIVEHVEKIGYTV